MIITINKSIKLEKKKIVVGRYLLKIGINTSIKRKKKT